MAKHLFIDDRFVAEASGLTRRFHHNDAYADFPDEEEAATLRRIGLRQERALGSW